MDVTPAQRTQQARMAAHFSWAATDDRTARTAAARRAAGDRFDRLVDPDGTMDPVERAKRAANLRKAHFAQMAAKRWAKRRAA